jgi:hypothetical protein
MDFLISFDENQNTVDFFKKSFAFLKNKEDKFRFKWFIISFHSAIFCLMLLMIDSENIWKERRGKKIKDHLPKMRADTNTVDIFNKNNQLITFNEAFALAKDPKFLREIAFLKPFPDLPLQQHAMEALNDLRNDLVHFIPQDFGFDHSYIISIVSPIITMVEPSLKEMGDLLKVDDASRIKDSINKIHSFFKELSVIN